jgi:beta-glucosidase
MAALLGMGTMRRNPVKDIDYTDYAEGIWVGYRYFATAGKPVSYPFGYGLSYTTFAYSKPAVKVDKNGKVTATVTVTNTGKVAGKEVVELYVTAPDGGLVKPVFELKGFAKTKELRPGASETVTITIDPYTLASFNETTSAWETAAGNYTVHFGASSADIRGAATFKLAKPQSWPVHRVLLPAEPVKEISVK